jgi:hypothetical protein
MKLPIAFSIVAVAIGISNAFAGPLPGESPPAGGTMPPGTSSGGPGSTGARPTATPADESNTDQGDDTLYRGKTTETENPMLRDEGPLHFKTRPKEKIQEVDSLKNLPSSATDRTFQGSLLHSAADIENVNPKANDTRDAEDEGDPRFKAKRLVFKPDKSDESKKVQTDHSPSPTPSPTASPAAKNSSKK